MTANRSAGAAARALRLARRAWRLLHLDSVAARATAERSLALALTCDDAGAQGWARLALGFHLLYLDAPAVARAELERSRQAFDAAGDRPGHILASVGIARALWRDGHFSAAIEAALPLRDEGLQVLRHEQRGVLLNTIAGCYSARGDSEQAFAYMYQALRDAGPTRGHGFDVVLYCNLAHELLQLGDYHEALRYVDHGIERCAALANPRLTSVLLINRIICLIELGRAAESLPDVRRVHAMPTDASGRGAVGSHFEILALAALCAGDAGYGRELLTLAQQRVHTALPDETLELAIAQALEARSRGDLAAALSLLQAQRHHVDGAGSEGASLRIRCRFQQTLCEMHDALGDTAATLAALRRCHELHLARADLASRTRYQAAALQTELLRLQHRIDEKDAQRRATERARVELQHANEQLSRRIAEVQALQQALREQAVCDALTGLYNRRHLNDTLPSMLALARRDGQPLALALIDLDHFKSVNDQHGHAAGDTLLAAFGRLLAETCRLSDVACRYGGEEFCLLMPHTGGEAALQKVQALLQRWSAQQFVFGAAALAGLSFSAGVTDSERASGSVDALLLSADRQLLDAKRQGRQRVHLAPARRLTRPRAA